MPKGQLSAKRIAIDRANTAVLIAVGLTTFIAVFSIIAGKALLAQRSYQSKVIDKKETALKQLKSNVKEAEKLTVSYREFNGAVTNVLGGNPKGSGDKDGENARIVLDALPSKYDFPALATSINKLVASNNFALESIAGTDDEVNQENKQSSDSPAPVDMPFTVASRFPASEGKRFLELFERSIRPIQIQKISITGKDTQLEISITAKTYYQPAKTLNVKSETVPIGNKPVKNTRAAKK